MTATIKSALRPRGAYPGEAGVEVPLLNQGPQEHDEGEAEHHPEEGPPESISHPLVDEPGARRQHRPGRRALEAPS